MEEPYLLASYGVDSVTDADPFAVRVNGLQYQEDSVVNGSTSSRAKQRERQPVAVTTVQRNGVHLVDVSTRRCSIDRKLKCACPFCRPQINLHYRR